MSKLIRYTFICINFINVSKCDEIIPDLGIHVKPIAENVLFTSNSIDIKWSRVIENPCEAFNINLVFEKYPCHSNGTENFEDVPSRRNKYALELHHFKSRCYIEWEKLVKEIYFLKNPSSNRPKRSLIGAALTFTGLIKNFVDISSTIHSFFKGSKNSDMVIIKDNIVKMATNFKASNRLYAEVAK